MSNIEEKLAHLSPEQRQQLLKKLLNKPTASHNTADTTIKSIDRTASVPLSFGQQRLWFLDKLEEGNAYLYNEFSAATLTGVLQTPLFEQCLHEIIRRHEILRTSFPEINGIPSQHIHDDIPLALENIDLQELPGQNQQIAVQQLALAESEQPFDLSTGPLCRFKLVRLSPTAHVFFMCMHHIVCDNWSGAIFQNELIQLYEAYAANRPSPLLNLTIQYRDYSAWQQQWLTPAREQQQLDYWRQKLAGAPGLLNLPTDRPRPSLQSTHGACLTTQLDTDLTQRLKQLSQQSGVTLFMTLLAGFACLLNRYSHQETVVIGSPTAHRQQRETEDLIGFFINTLLFRVDLNETMTVDELLAQVKQTALEAYQHQDIPFERLVERLQPERSLSHAPLFQAMLVLHNAPVSKQTLADLTIEPLAVAHSSATFDITLLMHENAEGLSCTWEYNTDLFLADTITRMARHLQRLLEALCQRHAGPVTTLELLTEIDTQQLLAFNPPEQQTEAHNFIDLFESQAAKTPNAPALVLDTQSLSYGQLNEQANQLSHALLARGLPSATLIAVSLERSPTMIVALIGILKAGYGYLPLDPDYPAERLQFMLEDSNAAALLSQTHLLDRLPTSQTHVICIDTEQTQIALHEKTNPGRSDAQQTAYVIYTSGSTGKPKGTVVDLAALTAHCLAIKELFVLTAQDKVLQFASLNFDASAEQIFPTLISGACLTLLPTNLLTPEEMLVTLHQKQITVAEFPPQYWKQLLMQPHKPWPNLRLAITGGEELPPEVVQTAWSKLPATALLVNTYGPTEGVISASALTIANEDSGRWPHNVPIGKPLVHKPIFILDAHRQPLPVGIPGELHIGGHYLAQGYLNHPELSAEKFIEVELFGKVRRLYKTGDLARWLADGNLEYLGRIDRQIKIRGFRIELGEIETLLTQYPSINEAVVMPYETDHNKRLVAYFSLKNGTVASDDWATQLRDWLKQRLPDYMLPSAYTLLDALPLTASGKIDRNALPKPDLQAEAEPQSTHDETERLLLTLCSQLLGIDLTSAQIDFFAAGGHSLLATQLIARIRDSFNTEVPLRAVFEYPKIQDLARYLMQQQGRPVLPVLTAQTAEQPLMLSFAQQRLWFLDQLEGGSATYHIPALLQLDGALNLEALQNALTDLVARHQSLRQCFPEQDNQPQVKILAAYDPLSQLDLSMINANEQQQRIATVTTEFINQLFQLDQGPLLRLQLIKLNDQRHLLLFVIHHIIADGQSMDLLLGEWTTLYRAYCQKQPVTLPALTVQYTDYAAWQRQWLHGEVLERQLTFWRKQLVNAPELLELPTDFPRPPVMRFKGRIATFSLDQALTDALKTYTRQSGSTLYMACLSAYAVLLSRYSQATDIVIGSPISNRNTLETENLVGFLVNTLALRIDLSGQPTFTELLKRVRHTALAAYSHQDTPFEAIVEALQPSRHLDRTPLYQVMFGLQTAPDFTDITDALQLTPLALETQTARCDLTLLLNESGQGLDGLIEYNTDLFHSATIERLIRHFSTLLSDIVRQPEQSIHRLQLLSRDEIAQQQTWNNTQTHYPNTASIAQLFAAQAQQTPDAIALVFEDSKLSYRELDARANRLAHYLAAYIRPDTEALIGLYLERSPEQIITVLAILKAGGAYLALDPAYPKETLAVMLAEAKVTVLVSQQTVLDRLPEQAAQIVCIDTLMTANTLAAYPVTAPELSIGSEHLAYVSYTSGSTGQPKGVCIPQKAVIRLVKNTGFMDFSAEHTFLAFAPLAFDASTLEIWGPLLNGAKLVIMPPGAASLETLGQIIQQQGIDSLWLTSGLFNQMIDERLQDLTGVKQLLAGGDVLSTAHVKKALQHLPNTRLINGYGPTENTTFTCCFDISLTDCDGAIPIGRPIANSQAYILDADLQPVPVGVVGELYAGGDGLARGYLQQPALTSEKFIETELFGKQQRLYKTGDRARYRPDGVIEFFGRADNQIKLRGFRIELDAISAVLNQWPGIRESVATIKTLSDTDRRLFAYIVTETGFDEASCRTYLKQQLPDYMQPSALLILEQLPLTANGKIDRNALPDAPQTNSDDVNVPRTAVEEILHGLWCEILHLDSLDIDANFFDCGGHSLLATQLISRIRRHFAIELPLRNLFEAPTIRALATRIESVRGQNPIAKPPITPSQGTDPVLSFAQERLWFLDQLEPNNPFYNVPLALRLNGQLNIDALAQSLACIIDRHAVLRTTFSKINGKPVLNLAPEFPTSPLLTAVHCNEAEVETLVREEAQKTFDLAHDPLVRMTLLQLSGNEHVLLLTLHHIVADGWSLGILVNELLTLYPALLKQQTPALAPLPIQYADFAHWQRQWLSGETLDTQFNYWQEQLADAPPSLNLPTDHPRPAVQSFQGSSELFHIDAPTSQALKALTRQQGATLFMTLFSAFSALLHRYSNQDDLVIGAPIANRNHAEIEPLIGFFVNTLALRVKFTDDLSFAELLAQVRQTALDAYSHQDLPFEKLVDGLKIERDLSRNPIFQVMFALQNAPVETLSLPDLGVTPIFNKGNTALFDMVLDIWEDGEQLTGVLEYNTDLFESVTILRFISHFKNLLQALIAEPTCPVRQLALLDTDETAAILQLGEGAAIDYPTHTPLSQLFEQQVRQTPEAIAAVHRPTTGEALSISYAELNRHANRIAHALRELGVQPNSFVGILENRGLDCLSAMLGIMKAGAAFLPIDPNYPDDRIQYMITDSQIPVLISRRRFADKIAALQDADSLQSILSLDDPHGEFSLPVLWGEALNQQPVTDPSPVNQATDTAYILYTSGSTGLPKGAMVRHNGAVNHILAEFDALKLHQDSAFLQSAPSSSDISVWQFLAPLLIGGRTVIIDFETVCEASQLFQVIHEQKITLFELVPIVLKNLLDYAATLPDHALPTLECAMVTGEAVSTALVNQWLNTYPDIALINAYGPTEAADDICQAVLDTLLPAAQINVPIGKPLANLNLYVLDRQQQLMPAGAYGEICVSGIGVGSGYWRNSDKTAASFVANPFQERYDHHHAIIYRTGDLGRWLPDGSLEFIGRLDQQVKIRGFRIELGEIEGVLTQFPAVREAAVIVREDQPGDKQLAAYLVAAMQGEALADDIDHLHNEQVALWQDLHEDSYGDAPSHADPTFNIIGWDSNYTGQQLPDADMREYIDHTIAAIIALKPRNMLEIGCGTGLLMYRLVPHCLSYTGTDLSSVALQRLEKSKADLSIPGLQHARFLTQMADDFTGFDDCRFDTVVINSVVQYFPSIDYLSKVIAGLTQCMAPGGSIFIGDIRDLALLKAFHTSVQRYKADANTTAGQLLQRISQHLLQEQEMAIAPAFFRALKDRFPQIGSVEIRPKRGLIRNEMSCFRYDVILRLDAAEHPEPLRPDWLDWRQQPLTIETIEALLNTGQPPCLALRGIVNARVIAELDTLAWLDQADDDIGIAAIKQPKAQSPALDPQRLWQIGTTSPYSIHIGCALDESLPAGSFNVIFTHRDTPVTARQISDALFPNLATGVVQYANNPLREKFARALIPKLRHFLKEKLPEHMIPAHFVVLEQLPQLPNGKIDRDALPAPDAWQHKLERAYTPPATPLQQQLATIWCAVLGLEKVGIHDNFFELGGHSLKATQVVSRIYKDLAVEVSLRELFGQPTIAELADIIDSRQASHYQTIPVIADAEYYPLSHAQKRLWVLAELGEDSGGAYQMSEALILEGSLDPVAFNSAFKALIARHESLRTTFITVEGEPRQKVHDTLSADVRFADLSMASNPLEQARQRALADNAQGFDLTTGPLLRITLLKLAEQQHAVLFNMHHIISDGWSMNVLEQDFLRYYQALADRTHTEATLAELLPPLPIQYRDYAAWQNQQLQSEAAAVHRNYWLAQLAGEIPVLNLPTDWPRPPIKSYCGATHSFTFSTEQYQALSAFSQAHEASLFMTLTALVNTLFYRYSQQQDIIIGTPVAGRDQFELEAQIGFYINTLVLRNQLNGAMTFTNLLAQIKQTTLAAYEHQIYPFDRLVQELNLPRDVSRSPLFDVMLVMQNIDPHEQQFDALQVQALPVDYGSSQFDMTLSFEPYENGLRATIWYNTDLYLAARIERLSRHLLTLTDAILTDSGMTLEQLPLLPESEQKRLLPPLSAHLPVTTTLVECFETQATKTPDAIAVCFNHERLSYAQLNERANRLAHRLLALGVTDNAYIGLCVERSLDMIVGILAILKAGAAYVPLDPTYPVERLAFMQEDAGLRIVLTQQTLWQNMLQQTRLVSIQPLYLDAEGVSTDGDCTNPSVKIQPDDIAYIIYTSGSTGKPKGVLIPHANVVRLLTRTDAWFGFNERDVWTLFHSYAFDFSVWELWGALLYGGRLVVVPYLISRSPEAFYQLLCREQVTVLNQTPSAFRQLIEAEKSASNDLHLPLRYVVFGGEALDMQTLRPWFERHGDQIPQLINMYGITETTVHVTYKPLSLIDLNHPSSNIGQAIPDLQLYVLDPQGQLAPIGVPGELHVGGAGLATGYLNRAELTEERFISHPFRPGERLYKTGDLARYLDNGDLDYLGRIDNQVKIRGFRIELGEIEAQITQHPAIREALVLAPKQNDQARLIAYYIVKTDHSAPNTSELRRFLQQNLPDYMIPSALIALDAFPLTPSGKIDNQTLQALEQQRPTLDSHYVAPQNTLEQALTTFWQHALEVPQVGILDNIFDLGAHSVLVIQVRNKLQAHLGREIPAVLLFQYPTIKALADYLSLSTDNVDSIKNNTAQKAQTRAQQRQQVRQRRNNEK